MKNWWQEITGYSVSFFGWFFHSLPGTCQEWTQLFILLTLIVTFFGITLPKAWDNIKKRWRG